MIRKPPRADSFYEAVSDLMFGTMAIMVMLMCVFMALNKKEASATPEPPPPPAPSPEPIATLPPVPVVDIDLSVESEVAELRDRVKALRDNVQQVESQAKKTQEEIQRAKNLEGKEIRDIELVVMIDVTGSMQREIEQLRESLDVLARSLPRIVQTFRMAIVAYRRDQTDSDVTRVFPMTTIAKVTRDQGLSLRKVEAFTQPIQAQSGSAPFESALKTAISQFSSDSFDGQQTLFVIGDVGPYEARLGDQIINPEDTEAENRIRSQITQWQTSAPRRNVTMLYTGVDEIELAVGQQKQKFERSRDFFKQVATDLKIKDSYSESPGDMLPLLILKSLG